MRLPALGETAAHLPWLSPCAGSLLALVRSPSPQTWSQLRLDPGAVLLLVRQVASTLSVPGWSFFPALLHHPGVAEGAARHLEQSPGGFVDWNQPAVQPIYHTSWNIARLAQRIAERIGRCDPENAWVAGLLAPLGWLAVCAVDPHQAAACLADPGLLRHSSETQKRHWGLDQSAIARRLTRHWGLPNWLAGVIGRLALPAEVARGLGFDPDLLRVIQLAVSLAQQPDRTLHLALGTGQSEIASDLGLPETDLEMLQREAAERVPPPVTIWEPPASQPLLRELLLLAAENRRLRGTVPAARLENELDDLHQTLEDQCTGEVERLQTRKLAALAEFAAGAGHEINNPLAVISGQAQYLLGHLRSEAKRWKAEENPAEENGEHSPENGQAPVGLLAACCLAPAEVERSLQVIIDQAQRIHGVVRDLWHFARPAEPKKQAVDLPGLIGEVSLSLGELAAHRRVQLRWDPPTLGAFPTDKPPDWTVLADPQQLRTALTCLVRNAIEAAPEEGWARVRVEMPAPDQVDVLVEDNGTPPALLQREHLFDPFYSGRPAGRGRGMGLPTAWRLARAHGGDVRYVGLAGEPTRFVLSLPHEVPPNGTSNSDH